MKRELVPYYISRAILSAGLGAFFVLIGRWTWYAALCMGILMFGLFLWYAHSGSYLIDPSTPLTPLRRDARGKDIRNRALVIAVAVGGVGYVLLSLLELVLPSPPELGGLAIFMGVIVYFAASIWLFARGASNTNGGDI
jgi:hypothetical protein